jgi:hypothetical protein
VIKDNGFYVEAMQMVVKKKLGVYGLASYIDDDSSGTPGRRAAD